MRANLDCGAIATLEARGVDADEALDRLIRVISEMPDFE
jgi:phosphotransferase system HPr-like phosphotransfer protein